MEQRERKQPSRWEVHQAIETAISEPSESELVDALRTIIRFGSKLPKQSVEISRVSPGKKHDSVQGHAEGIGDVEVQTNDPKRSHTWTYGEEKERVGHYRMRRVNDSQIEFHHYWASEAATSASEAGAVPSGAFGILYGWKTHEPLAFARIHYWQPLPFLKSRGINIWLSRSESLWTNPTRKIWTGHLDAFIAILIAHVGVLVSLARPANEDGGWSALRYISAAFILVAFLWVSRSPIARHQNR